MINYRCQNNDNYQFICILGCFDRKSGYDVCCVNYSRMSENFRIKLLRFISEVKKKKQLGHCLVYNFWFKC